MSIKALKEQRAKVWEDMKAIDSKATEEKRDLLSEEQEAWDKGEADIQSLDKQIARQERAKELAGKLERDIDKVQEETGASRVEAEAIKRTADENFSLALTGWAKRQAGLDNTPEELEAAEALGYRVDRKDFEVSLSKKAKKLRHVGIGFEERAQATTPDSAGGALIPEGFVNELEKRMLFFGPMLNVARILRTDSGNDLPWPTVDDTSNSGQILAENAAVSEQDVTLSSVTFNAYKYTSDLVKVSQELMEDSAFDMADLLADLLGERLGRIANTHATTGTGSSQPNGCITAAGVGKTAAAAAAITGDELIDLFHSLDVAYRANAIFQANDATIAEIRKLKGSTNDHYLWQPGLAAGNPDLLLGKPIMANNDIATLATTAKTVIFGDFSKYIIRQVRGIRFRRLDELYAANDQVGFVAFNRWDGDAIQANALKVLQQA